MSHFLQHPCPTVVWFWEMIDLDSNGTGTKIDTDSGIWLRSSWDSNVRVKIGSKIGSKSKNWCLHTPPSMKCYHKILVILFHDVLVPYEIESPLSYELHWWKKCVNINSWFETHFWINFDSPFWISTCLSQIPESVSVFAPVPFESKLIISQNHTALLDKSVEQNNSRIIFENWKLGGDNFLNKTIHFIIIFMGYIWKVPGGFLRIPYYLDWVATLGPIRPPPEPPHEIILLPFPFISCIYIFTMHWGQCMR